MNQVSFQREPNQVFTMLPDGTFSFFSTNYAEINEMVNAIESFGGRPISQDWAQRTDYFSDSGHSGQTIEVSGVYREAVRAAGYHVITPNFHTTREGMVTFHSENPAAIDTIRNYLEGNEVQVTTSPFEQDDFLGQQITAEANGAMRASLQKAHYKLDGHLITDVQPAPGYSSGRSA